MNKKYAKVQSTRRSLIMSMISLILCFAMLLGTTWAWFTDEVTSGVNQIKAGNLDIDVQYTKDNGATWADLEGAGTVFSSNLWEPGHTEYVTLKIENKGTLALKYCMNVTPINEKGGINMAGESFKLSDYLVFGTTEPASTVTTYTRDTARAAAGTVMQLNQTGLSKTGEMLAGDAAEYVTLVVYMPETVGNEANYKTGTTAPEIELGIKLIATQLQSESDSFNNEYDKDIAYPAIDTVITYNYFPQVSYVAQLKKAETKAVKDGEDANVSETDTQVTIQSEEKTTDNKPYAKATFNNTDVETYDEHDKAAVELKAKKVAEGNIVIGEQERESVTYDVSVVAVTGAMKENTLFTVDLFVGEGKQNVSVTHKGAPDVVMNEVDTLETTPDTFAYNASTGYVTMLVNHFSEFMATYNAPVAAVGTTAYYSLTEAAKDAQDKTIVMLRDTVETGNIDLSEATLDLNGKNVKLEGEVALPDGLTKDENGNVIEETPAAIVGGKKFIEKDLQSAFAYAMENGKPVVFNKDTTISFGTKYYVEIPKEKALKIDLNGCKVNIFATKNNTSAFLCNKGILELSDSKADSQTKFGAGELVFTGTNPDPHGVPGYASNLITNYGHLTINSGYYENQGTGYACYVVDNEAENAQWQSLNDKDVTLTINGGKFRTNASSTIRMYLDTEGVYNNAISINNADVGSLWLQDNSESQNAKGTLTIKNTTFMYAINVGYYQQAEHVTVNLEDSHFTSIYYTLPYNGTHNQISVKDCTFDYAFCMRDPGKVLDKNSGTFGLNTKTTTDNYSTEYTCNLSDCCKDGYAVHDNGDGTYSVVQASWKVDYCVVKQNDCKDCADSLDEANTLKTQYATAYPSYTWSVKEESIYCVRWRNNPDDENESWKISSSHSTQNEADTAKTQFESSYGTGYGANVHEYKYKIGYYGEFNEVFYFDTEAEATAFATTVSGTVSAYTPEN